jgi:hypothetical protein
MKFPPSKSMTNLKATGETSRDEKKAADSLRSKPTHQGRKKTSEINSTKSKS